MDRSQDVGWETGVLIPGVINSDQIAPILFDTVG
jgi:hypothetical protein